MISRANYRIEDIDIRMCRYSITEDIRVKLSYHDTSIFVIKYPRHAYKVYARDNRTNTLASKVIIDASLFSALNKLEWEMLVDDNIDIFTLTDVMNIVDTILLHESIFATIVES